MIFKNNFNQVRREIIGGPEYYNDEHGEGICVALAGNVDKHIIRLFNELFKPLNMKYVPTFWFGKFNKENTLKRLIAIDLLELIVEE